MQVKNVCCIGAGYVGGPTMAVIALKCPHINVIVVDDNKEKIDSWNGNLDNLPVYEPGLKKIIKKVRGKNLFFSKNIDLAITNSEIIFMAVNTPTKKEGIGAGMAANLVHVERCAKRIARVSNKDKIVVEKSTLPVRTAEKIKEILFSNNKKNNFEVLSNPEFLAEGTAIQDLYKSDRVLIGGDSTINGEKAVRTLVEIYLNWIPREKILTTNVWSSELSKLASNAMLAQRISSINSLSALCQKSGADIGEVAKAIGMDHRIGPKFLKASVGFGGSCFKKDILNLVYLSQYYGLDEVAEYWIQVIKINEYQKRRFCTKIIDSFNGKIINKKITILGWAFKKNTNDSRESASIYVAKNLLKNGAKINIYDPMVNNDLIFNDLMDSLKELEINKDEFQKISKNFNIHNNHYDALFNCDAIAILTEWEEFKNYNWNKIIEKSEFKPVIFDGRNILKEKKIKTKINFIG